MGSTLSFSPVNLKTSFYGPEEAGKQPGQRGARNHYNLSFNETSSLTDEVVYQANVAALLDATKQNPPPFAERISAINKIKTEVLADPYYAGKQDTQITEEAVKRFADNPKNFEGKKGRTAVDVVIAHTKKELDDWLNPETLIHKYASQCEEHLKRRVDNFLLQLVTTFNTHLHFEIGPTQDQAESAKSLYAEYDGKLEFVCRRNAAHSSTFPCLIAYDKEEWKAFVDKKAVKPKGIYYLQKSDIYKGANSTMNMPDGINKADIDVDGVHHDSEFNKKSLALINASSMGNLSIKQAMEEFIISLKAMIEKKEQEENRLDVKRALSIYRQKIETIQQEFNQSPEEWIFLQINLLVNQTETTSHLRAVMLQIRAKAIKRNMRAQSEIMHRVDVLGQSILKEIRKGRKKAPPNFREAFHSVLIDKMRSEENRQRISKLFALSFSTQNGRQKTQIEATKKLIEEASNETQKKRIESLAREIANDMRRMQTEEVQHRGDAMRKLRRAKGWTQVKLGQEIRQRYPQECSSQATISRTETGNRYMSLQLARELSETFKVPVELLLPQFFYV